MWSRPSVIPITPEDFRKMIEGGKILVREKEMPVAILDANRAFFIKVWHRKPGFSSDRLWPYGYRFYSNCRKLLARGVEAPRVERYMRIVPGGQHVAAYRYMPGRSMEDLLADAGGLPIKALAEFLAELHDKGVHFRSLHPGNILRLENGRFALIDVTDTQFYPRPLDIKQRARNLSYAWTRGRSRHLLNESQVAMLLSAYSEAAKLTESAVDHLRQVVARGSAGH